MANETFIQYGTQILVADHAGDFTGGTPTTAANSRIVGTPVNLQMDMGGLAASGGGGRQSNKTASLGVQRGTYYKVDACIELALAPTDGVSIDMYWSDSPSATAGTGNTGGVTGADSAYVSSVGSLGQMTYIGALICRAQTINIGKVGVFTPEHQYGTLVVINNANQNFAANMGETHVTLTPIVYVPGT